MEVENVYNKEYGKNTFANSWLIFPIGDDLHRFQNTILLGCNMHVCTSAQYEKTPTKCISYWSFWIHTSVITFVIVFFNHDVFFWKLGHLKSLAHIYIWFHICIYNCLLIGFGHISCLVNICIWFYICICIYIYYVSTENCAPILHSDQSCYLLQYSD